MALVDLLLTGKDNLDCLAIGHTSQKQSRSKGIEIELACFIDEKDQCLNIICQSFTLEVALRHIEETLLEIDSGLQKNIERK